MSTTERYNELREEVLKNLNLIEKKLDEHQRAFLQDSSNWGYIGDLSSYNDRLKEILGA